MTTYADQTDYPKIFSDTYWGNTRYEDALDLPDEIIKNRNDFAERFKIKTNITHKKRKHTNIINQIKNQFFWLEHMKGQTCDHVEFYDNGIAVIGVSSNYNNFDEISWVEAGFHQIDPLYALDSHTFAIQLFY
jgi:hypothetical protein